MTEAEERRLATNNVLDALQQTLDRTAPRINRSCPCAHTTPCQDACPCTGVPTSFVCRRCCSYGSARQQQSKAEALVDIFESVTRLQERRAEAESYIAELKAELQAAQYERDEHQKARLLLATDLSHLASGEEVSTFLAEQVRIKMDKQKQELIKMTCHAYKHGYVSRARACEMTGMDYMKFESLFLLIHPDGQS